MTDAEAIEATRQGNRHAFAELVARYQRMVEGVAYCVAGERALVDDIVQDTFVTAWRTIDSLRDSSRVRAWLGGIARNVALNARRRRTTRREAPAIELVGDRTVFDQVVEQQRDREIAAALERLPRRYREPLVLFYYEHCTVKEVADALALREDAVMQRLSRGRRRLGEQLAARVEVGLEKRPSRTALGAALLLLLPARAARAAAPAKASLLVAHWRIPAAGLAVTAAAVVLGLGVQRSNAIAAKAQPRPAEANKTAPTPPQPKLPADPLSERVISNISIPSLDPVEACRRAISGLVMATLDPKLSLPGEDRVNYMPPADVLATARAISTRAAAQCEGTTWPEIYMICEGTRAEILDGNITCYPYDPFAS
ncbi:MAG TPA: sigma-70 family RNA polymerase sigma factor [Kofleriaceae bacterium]